MFQQQPELGLVATDHHIINTDGENQQTRADPELSSQGALLSLLQHCIFSQPTVMVRKECHDEVGLYKNTYAQDYDMWIRIARRYPVGVIHKPLAMYRRHKSNRSGKSSSSKVHVDIRSFICEIMDTLSLEELVPGVQSAPHVYDIRGAVFIKHDLYKRAGREFHNAVKAEPQDMIHRFWSGILLRRMAYYEDANGCFRAIPAGHRLHDSSLNAVELTSRLQAIDSEDEAAVSQIRRDLNDEHGELMDMTVAFAAAGQI